MNLSTIHREIAEKLKRSKPKVRQRRQVMAELAAGLKKKRDLPLLRRREVWFSTTQGITKAATGAVRVQSLGIDVGGLTLDSKSKDYWFRPNVKNFRNLPELRDVRWKWSHASIDAKAIRAFLKISKLHPKANQKNEREIQWQLAHALRATAENHKALRHLQPVTWRGRFTEIGVSVNLSGEPGTGNIDILVRRGEQFKRGFLAFEVKAPGDSKVEAALQQALRYATALDIEANGNNDNTSDEQNRKNYHAVFGSGAKGELEIGVVLVMEDSDIVREIAPSILERYWCDKGDSKIDRLGMLLYKYKENKVTSWRWLDGWDARSVPKC